MRVEQMDQPNIPQNLNEIKKKLDRQLQNGDGLYLRMLGQSYSYS